MLAFPDSRKEDLEDGRRGVVGRERGLRLPEPDRFVLLPAWGVVEEDILESQCAGSCRKNVLVGLRRWFVDIESSAALFPRDARSFEE
jgi:hypothetical protein